jgi:large subunit ribosomal protein L28
MSKVCEICGKGPLTGKNVSHSNTRTPKTWHPNLKKMRIVVNNSTKNANVCTKCLKAGKIVRAI